MSAPSKTPLEAPPAALRPAAARLDAGNAAAFRADFRAAAAAGRPLTVDLSAVAYMDAFGLEALLDGVRASRGAVTFVGVRAELRDFLRRNDVLGFLRAPPGAGG